MLAFGDDRGRSLCPKLLSRSSQYHTVTSVTVRSWNFVASFVLGVDNGIATRCLSMRNCQTGAWDTSQFSE